MPALNNKYIADIPYMPEELYSINITTPTPIIFTMLLLGLILIKYTQKAIAKFNIVLNSYFNKYY